MSINDYPRLCGGVFFTYLLYARKQRAGVREHYMGESDGLSDPEAFLLSCKDGTTFAGLTSSNLAVRDAQKIEMASITSLSDDEAVSAYDFYEGLKDNSIPVKDFDETADYSHHLTIQRNIPPKSRLMYIAPFYKDSASHFEKNIETIIGNAKKRIIVCAQHVCSFNYSYQEAYTELNAPEGIIRKGGFLSEVLKKAKSGIQTQLLSQTYVDSRGSHGCRIYCALAEGYFSQNQITIIRILSPISLSYTILKLYFIRLHMKFEGAISSYDQF